MLCLTLLRSMKKAVELWWCPQVSKDSLNHYLKLFITLNKLIISYFLL